MASTVKQTWYPDERPGEKRPERYCPNVACRNYTVQVTEGEHCPSCTFYYMPGTHPHPREPSS